MRTLLFTVFLSFGLLVPAFAQENGTYRPGNAYHSVIAKSPALCAAQCKGDAQCKGWNFVRPRQLSRTGVCEFNARKVSAVPSSMSVSGENSSVRDSQQIIPSGGNTLRIESEPVITPPFQNSTPPSRPSMTAVATSPQSAMRSPQVPARTGSFASGMDALAGADPRQKFRYNLEGRTPNAVQQPAATAHNQMGFTDPRQLAARGQARPQMPAAARPQTPQAYGQPQGHAQTQNQPQYQPQPYGAAQRRQAMPAGPSYNERLRAATARMQNPAMMAQRPMPQTGMQNPHMSQNQMQAGPMPQNQMQPGRMPQGQMQRPQMNPQHMQTPNMHARQMMPRPQPQMPPRQMQRPQSPQAQTMPRQFSHNLDGRARAQAPTMAGPSYMSAQNPMMPSRAPEMPSPLTPRVYGQQAPQQATPHQQMMQQRMMQNSAMPPRAPQHMPQNMMPPQPQMSQLGFQPPMPRPAMPRPQMQAPQMPASQIPAPRMQPQPQMAMEPHMMARQQMPQQQMAPQIPQQMQAPHMMPRPAMPQAQARMQAPAPHMMPQAAPMNAQPQAPQMRRHPMTAAQAEQSLFGSLHDDVTVPASLSPEQIPADPNAPIPTVRRVPTGEIATAQLPRLR